MTQLKMLRESRGGSSTGFRDIVSGSNSDRPQLLRKLRRRAPINRLWRAFGSTKAG
jgi:hypothetical protein